jgi:hypothetical protein
MKPRVSFLRHAAFVSSEDFVDEVTIVGCGAVGSHIALFLAKMGCQKFKLYDADIVESHNLPNQTYTVEHIDMPKVEALKKVLEEFNSDIKITCHNKFFTSEDKNTVVGPLILATDTMKSRQEIYDIFYLNTDIDYVFEVRLGFDYGELNIINNINPVECENWKKTLKDDSEIPDGPCNLRICTTLVAMVSAQAVHMISSMYAARRKSEQWTYKKKTIFALEPNLSVHTF